MPGGTATYEVVACATANVVFTPGALPHPVVDSNQIVNGNYFLLTNQNNTTNTGIWYADPAGPVAIMTAAANGINPNVAVTVGPGLGANGGTTYVYSASSHGVPGFVIV